MIYWTKRLVDEDGMFTGELDTIKEDDLNFVPDGDGFQINMNGINTHVLHQGYLKRFVLMKEYFQECIPVNV